MPKATKTKSLGSQQLDTEKLDTIEKPILEYTDAELHYILDTKWYPRANEKLNNQRKIWDYSYLAYKGIMLNDEINRKRRANGYGIYINVPRTFATIEGIRKNFNINQLKIDIEKTGPELDEQAKMYKIRTFLNYDLDRSKTRKQIKDAGFNKILYGNGFLYSFLMDRSGKYYNISGKVDEKTGRVEVTKDSKSVRKYYGMVARSISPYKVFPDPDGTTIDVDDNIERLCNYHCIRTVKHIANFRRDWSGIIPDAILSEVQPGGLDMTNYEAIKETIDYMFNMDALRYTGSVPDYISNSGVKVSYDAAEQMVEERIWLGEDFLIVQAGKGMKICLVSPNPNPEKRINLVKLDDVTVPGEYWAMGQPYIMRYQQIAENRVDNSVLDMIHFAISGMVGVQANYLEDPTDLEIYPEKVWKFKAMPGVKIQDVLSNFQPSTAGIPPALAYMNKIKADGQQATSITDFVMGASKSIADTATESNRLAGASDLTIVDKVREMVSGAMIETCKNWFSMYPVVYEGEKIKFAYQGTKLYFCGKKMEQLSEKELTEILKEYQPEDIIYSDDLEAGAPIFKITGDIEVSKDLKFRQWVAAIDFAKGVNQTAFETGDPRRLDIIKMGVDAMGNFDVIPDPDTYRMEGQPTKMDQIKETAMAGAAAGIIQNTATQDQNGGRPAENKATPPKSDTEQLNSSAQDNSGA